MEENTRFANLRSTKGTETKTTIEYPPVTLPEGATPAVIGPFIGGDPLYLHKAEGTQSYDRDELFALKFRHHTAEQFATLVWQSDDWNDRIVQLNIELGEIAAADLDMTSNVSIRDLSFGVPRGDKGFGGKFEFAEGADLSDVETITMLAAHNVGITSDLLKSLPNPHRLVRLELDTADVLPADLSRFSNLEVLQLGGIEGTNDVSYLASMPNISSLGIRHSDFEEFGNPRSPGVERLRALDIAYNRRVGSSLAWLDRAESLWYLDVSGTAVDIRGLWSLRERHKLLRLRVQCCPGIRGRIDPLSKMPNLIELNVAGNRGVTDFALEHIASVLPRLQHLDLRATGVTKEGIRRFLPKLRDLRVLGVSGELLDVGVAEHLKETTLINSLIVVPTENGPTDNWEWAEAADYFGAIRTTGNPV
jgi:hypothetical protein